MRFFTQVKIQKENQKTEIMLKKVIQAILLFFYGFNSFGQDSIRGLPTTKIYEPNLKVDTQSVALPVLPKITLRNTYPSKKKQCLIAGVNIIGYGSSLIILNSAWYKNYA